MTKAACESGKAEARIHSARFNYYKKGLQAALDGETPSAALWPLLTTWTNAALALSEEDGAPWRSACHTLGLAGERFAERVQGLDQYLDELDILLDEMAQANGLETQ